MFTDLHIYEATVNIPSIGSNGTAVIDVPVTGPALGTHIISWEPVTTATTLDDLILTFMVVADDEIRIVAFNPTGGAIDPDPIDFQFFTGRANPDLVE